MKNFILGLCAVFFLLNSCAGDKEYVYNEIVADRFLATMNQTDEIHENLFNGVYDSDNATAAASAIGMIDGYMQQFQKNYDEVKKLEHSEKATEFHNQVLKYIEMHNTRYIPALKNYASDTIAGNRAPKLAELEKIKDELDAETERTLEIQKAYFSDAGIIAK